MLFDLLFLTSHVVLGDPLQRCVVGGQHSANTVQYAGMDRKGAMDHEWTQWMGCIFTISHGSSYFYTVNQCWRYGCVETSPTHAFEHCDPRLPHQRRTATLTRKVVAHALQCKHWPARTPACPVVQQSNACCEQPTTDQAAHIMRSPAVTPCLHAT